MVIATEDSNIGMGGPAMIEGGGLGVYDPTAIGPIEVQRANGVVDIVVADEAAAVAAAKRYLSYFQGTITDWVAPDDDGARAAVPVDRLRAYDMRRAVDAVFDVGSILELRSGFGVGMITALARIEGRPVGVIANNPTHLAGAIDSDGADKAARFMQLCDAFGLPIVSLVDTPGMMVGPEVEATALVRHCSRLFVTGANITVPLVSIVTRKAYGLGAQAMMGGSTKAPLACLAWPTGEFGGMGLEGAVRLGYRKELEAATDDASAEVVVQDDGRPDVRTRQGGERRDALRDRRRDRPGRHPPLDHHPARRRPRDPLERHRRLRHPPPPQHRHLVTVTHCVIPRLRQEICGPGRKFLVTNEDFGR